MLAPSCRAAVEGGLKDTMLRAHVCPELVKPRKRSSLGCIRAVGALLQQRVVDAKAQCRYAGHSRS